jgi:DNA-binding response OmpR family regulator
MARAILVIAGDPARRRGTAVALRHAAYEAREAGDGASGAELALAGDLDLVLLDLALQDGFEALRRIRRVDPGLPVIVVAARDADEARRRGLSLGADDYLVEPFSVRELLARVDVALRRPAPREVLDRFALPDGEVDLERRELRFADGTSRELSRLEADLLRYLARSRARTVSRAELLAGVWRQEPDRVATRTVDMTISRLRQKLRRGRGPEVLVTVRGKGYRLEP